MSQNELKMRRWYVIIPSIFVPELGVRESERESSGRIQNCPDVCGMSGWGGRGHASSGFAATGSTGRGMLETGAVCGRFRIRREDDFFFDR